MTILNTDTKIENGRVQHIHFVGIGGSGMSGIAEVLMNSGYQVSGSDLNENTATKRLITLGAIVYKGHEAEHINDADIVVTSSAVDNKNPEVIAAKHARIPVIPRAQMLAELMRTRFGIAIAGTHGKTTTTSLVTSILAEGGLDPTFVIGGLLNSAGTNAKLGGSQYIVAEADESDASFLYLKPKITIVTNIDVDHVWAYENSFEKIKQTFIEFLHHLPISGLAILCIDDDKVREVLPDVGRPMLTYGFSDDADIRATDFQQTGTQSHFKAHLPNGNVVAITLNLPGRHNVLNALAAIAVANEIGVDAESICRSLQKFEGIGRRFHMLGDITVNNNTALLIDDYGHHPKEILATLEAVKSAWPERRLLMAFQPHRFSRTQSLFDDFAQALSNVENLLLLDVYPAGEKPIASADGRSLCRAIRKRGKVEPVFVGRNDDIADVLVNVMRDGDILLLQGAGDVGAIAQRLIKEYSLNGR